MNTETPVSQELIPVKTINVPQLFTDKEAVDSLLSAITEKAREHEPDLSTGVSRGLIKSNANKVARSKTFLDNLGKEFVADKKAEIKESDVLRKQIRDTLDVLKAEVRKPLTDWEKSEEERKEKESLDEQFAQDWDEGHAEHDLFLRQKELERKEFELAKQEAERKAKEEAERLEKERAEREKRIAAEAEEKAKREAEERIRAAEIEALWRKRLAMIPEATWNGQEAFDRQTNEIIITYDELISQSDSEFEKTVSFRESELELREEQEAKAAAERAEKDEKERIRAAEQAEKDKAEAEKKAVADAEARRLAEEKAEREVAERKSANRNHQKKINREALACLVDNGFDETVGKSIIELVAKGKVKHIEIKY